MAGGDWRVTWDLQHFREPPEGIPILDEPDINGFRLVFRSAEEAAVFEAEMQRFLGHVLFRLSNNTQVPGALEYVRVMLGSKEA